MVTDDSLKRFYAEFGARIRDVRSRLGMTQAELASRLNLTRSSVANLETGRQHGQIHHLPLLSEALGVEIVELLPNLGGEAAKSSPDVSVESHLGGVSESAQQFVRDALRAVGPRSHGGS